MQRRARRQQELAALLGRDADETEEEYRARVMPLMEAMLVRILLEGGQRQPAEENISRANCVSPSSGVADFYRIFPSGKSTDLFPAGRTFSLIFLDYHD